MTYHMLTLLGLLQLTRAELPKHASGRGLDNPVFDHAHAAAGAALAPIDFPYPIFDPVYESGEDEGAWVRDENEPTEEMLLLGQPQPNPPHPNPSQCLGLVLGLDLGIGQWVLTPRQGEQGTYSTTSSKAAAKPTPLISSIATTATMTTTTGMRRLMTAGAGTGWRKFRQLGRQAVSSSTLYVI